MAKFWLVAWYEFRRHALRKQFIWALLSVPGIIALTIGMIRLAVALEDRSDAVGYVDQSGVLERAIPAPAPGSKPDNPVSGSGSVVPLVAYPDELSARVALDSGEIQAFYMVSADYRETKRVQLFYIEPPAGVVYQQFQRFLMINLLDDLPAEVAARAVAGSNLAVRWPDDGPGGGREFSQSTFLNNFVPLMIGMAMVALVMFASGYLISAVAEEKENRTMEVLVTSVSPDQLVAGKVVGILAVMLVQLIAWVVTGVLAVWIGGGWLNIEALQNVTVDLRLVGLMALVAVPTLVMISALMTAVGATVTEVQEGQQVTGLFIIPIVLPLWLLQVILERPDSPLAVALTLIPPCSVITTSVRLGFTSVPGWQIAVGSAIATVGALVSLWLAARAFRLGMLQYGKALNWRHLLAPAAAGPGRRSV